MPASYESFLPWMLFALVLGLKHGMDADHLATIDGLTRFNAYAGRPRLARWCGLLFSVGHGLVVCSVAVLASVLLNKTAVPAWLDGVGTWVSVFFLLVLGGLNLYAVLITPRHEMVNLVGLKGRWLGRLNRTSNPFLVALVGALFAFSFDTLSQAALFSAASAHFGGVMFALLLALSFVIGMVLTDAANGAWISHILKRADATARTASRVMGLTVAALSFGVAGLGLFKLFAPQIAQWQQGRELLVGVSVLCIVACSFVLARIWARYQLTRY